MFYSVFLREFFGKPSGFLREFPKKSRRKVEEISKKGRTEYYRNRDKTIKELKKYFSQVGIALGKEASKRPHICIVNMSYGHLSRSMEPGKK